MGSLCILTIAIKIVKNMLKREGVVHKKAEVNIIKIHKIPSMASNNTNKLHTGVKYWFKTKDIIELLVRDISIKK